MSMWDNIQAARQSFGRSLYKFTGDVFSIIFVLFMLGLLAIGGMLFFRFLKWVWLS